MHLRDRSRVFMFEVPLKMTIVWRPYTKSGFHTLSSQLLSSRSGFIEHACETHMLGWWKSMHALNNQSLQYVWEMKWAKQDRRRGCLVWKFHNGVLAMQNVWVHGYVRQFLPPSPTDVRTHSKTPFGRASIKIASNSQPLNRGGRTGLAFG